MQAQNVLDHLISPSCSLFTETDIGLSGIRLNDNIKLWPASLSVIQLNLVSNAPRESWSRCWSLEEHLSQRIESVSLSVRRFTNTKKKIAQRQLVLGDSVISKVLKPRSFRQTAPCSLPPNHLGFTNCASHSFCCQRRKPSPSAKAREISQCSRRMRWTVALPSRVRI